MTVKWMLFDLNSYFASCEQQENPALRGKPIAVIPALADSTSIIAASYEAKKFGIKTGTNVGEAKKMCPGLILKQANHKLYTEYHHKIIKAVGQIIPIEKVLSIDEVACRLIGREQSIEVATEIARRIKAHVKSSVGSEINSSIGIGPNILIAKIASDLQKPDGLVIIPKEQILEKLGPLPVEVISGVGAQMKHKLNLKGYFRISDLLKVSEQELKKQWGSILGLRISRELHGEDLSFRPQAAQKSFSHQHVLPPELRNYDSSFKILLKLLMKASFRLREERIKTRLLGISIKFLDGTAYEKSISFSESNETYFLADQLKSIWHQNKSKKPIKVAVVVGNLTDGMDQLSFFDSPSNARLDKALDSINSKFGKNTLFLATTADVLSHGKTKISFNHIPKAEDEFEEL